jgi:hypothetical protein
LPPGHPAIASSGYESHSFQFQASSFNSTTGVSDTEAFGFRAEPLNNNTANPSAKLDLFFGAGGSAPFTDTGFSFAANGIVTFAPGQTFTGASLSLPDPTTGSTGQITLGGSPFLSTTGSVGNLFLGYQSGFSGAVGSGNTSVGASSMAALTSGFDNTALGLGALENNTTGANNIAIGWKALFLNSSAGGNVALGSAALFSTGTGSSNTAIGTSALSGNTDGGLNTAIGYLAAAEAMGSGNTYLGAETSIADGVSNATAIGINAQAGESNSMILGASGVNVGIGTSTPHTQLEISAPAGNAFFAPNPVLALTGTGDGVVALDFNTNGISSTGTYNPAVRVAVLDAGGNSNILAFYANKPGPLNNGLQQTFAIDASGNAQITGALTVLGTLSKAGGAFKIDDPIDPSGKYLSHSFVESPDMMNIYNGNVITDADGSATVQLPDWFEALNRDFRYQLTAVGQFAQAMVASKIKDGKFTIRTDKPNVEISWQVTGIRHDAWANANRIPNEEAKPANEQGKYLHPELFGAGPEKAVGAVSAAKAAPENTEGATELVGVPGAQ